MIYETGGVKPEVHESVFLAPDSAMPGCRGRGVAPWENEHHPGKELTWEILPS